MKGNIHGYFVLKHITILLERIYEYKKTRFTFRCWRACKNKKNGFRRLSRRSTYNRPSTSLPPGISAWRTGWPVYRRGRMTGCSGRSRCLNLCRQGRLRQRRRHSAIERSRHFGEPVPARKIVRPAGSCRPFSRTIW